MKKPEEYIQDAIDNIYECDQPYFDNEVTCVYDGNSEAIFKAIEQAQKDAWNEALDKAAEDVDHLWDNNEIMLFDIDKDSILSLKIK